MTWTTSVIHVLLIEDNPGDARLIQEMLTRPATTQFRLVWVDSLSAGLTHLATGDTDAVLLDLSLPDSQGFDTLQKVHATFPRLPIVVLTGLDDEAVGVEAVQLRAQDYLVKGQVDRNLLGRALRYAIERKRAEVDLHERRRALHLVISSMPNLLLKVDEHNCLSALFAPPRFQTLLRLPGEPVGRPLNEVLPDEMAEQVSSLLVKVREHPSTHEREHSLILDTIHHFHISASPVLDTSETLVVIEEISALKAAEMSEREQRFLAEALRDIAGTLNSTLSLDEVLDRILTNLERVLPHDMAQIILYQEGTSALVRSRRSAGAGGEISIQDTPLPQPYTGEGAQGSSVSAPIYLDGTLIGSVNLVSNTTGFFNTQHVERLEAFANQAATALRNADLYEKLARYAAELESRNRELDAFGHTVAHDLKNPLNGIVGYVSLLQREPECSAPETQLCLNEIRGSAYKMVQIIDCLLLLAEVRTVAETIQEVDMHAVAQAALERFKPELDSGITVNLASNLPRALGYGPWLEEVFANLISNAIKYMGKQNAAPQLTIRGSQHAGLAYYAVQDNGIGIKPEDQARLFELFTRFHRDQASGLGLGLSIVQRIIMKLSGTLGVESSPGQGSTFWFALPAASNPHSDLSAEQALEHVNVAPLW